MAKRSKIVQWYMQKAYQTLAAADHNYNEGFYETAVNRAYYAAFYAATALLEAVGETRSKHSGVLAAFAQHFIKTGILPANLSKIYHQLLDNRERSDYELFIMIGQDNAQQNLQNARLFVSEAERWLKDQGQL